MDGHWWILLAVGVLVLTGLAVSWRPFYTAWREARFAEARRGFHRQRERLEAKFVQLGLAGAKPDGPRWTDCEFDDDVAYARSRSSGELSAFVAVTIQMQDLDAHIAGTTDTVRGLRAATAVFRFDGKHWETDGRAIFNLSPTEAIHFYQRDLEMVGQELAGQS